MWSQSLTVGCHLHETPTELSGLRKFWCFVKVDGCKGGYSWKFDYTIVNNV